MVEVVLLGSAQDGVYGVGCDCCSVGARYPVSIGLTDAEGGKHLFEATPFRRPVENLGMQFCGLSIPHTCTHWTCGWSWIVWERNDGCKRCQFVLFKDDA